MVGIAIHTPTQPSPPPPHRLQPDLPSPKAQPTHAHSPLVTPRRPSALVTSVAATAQVPVQRVTRDHRDGRARIPCSTLRSAVCPAHAHVTHVARERWLYSAFGRAVGRRAKPRWVVPAASEGHCHTARAGRTVYKGRSIWCLVSALCDGLGLRGWWCGDVLGGFCCTCGICVML
jgi:hypothetical protein